MRRTTVAVLAAAALPGCAFLADPISDVAQKAFTVPLFGKDGDPARTDGLTVQDLVAPMNAAPGSPAHLPDIPTGDWGAVLRFDQMARAGGGARVLKLSVSGLDFADPLDVTVRLTSRDAEARVLGRDSDKAGTELPDACHFAIDPATTTDETFSASLDGCITAFVDRYGAPVEPDVEIAVDAKGASGGLKEEGSLQASWDFTMHAENATTVGCKIVTMSEELQADAAYLRFEKMSLAGAGGSTEDVTLDAFADFYHPLLGFLAGGEVHQSISAGQRYWISRSIDLSEDLASSYQESGTVQPQLSPAGSKFLEGTVNALIDGGWGLACWRVSGAYPRDGFVQLTIAGTGVYAAPQEE